MRADALVGLGAVGLVLAAYFLGGSNQSVLESGGSGSTTSAFSGFGGVGTVGSSGGSANLSLSKGSGSGAASGGIAGVVQGSGSGAASGGVAGVVQGSGSGSGYPGGTAAGVYTGGADFQPTPKQADISGNSKQVDTKPFISGVSDGVIQGKCSGVTAVIQQSEKAAETKTAAEKMHSLGVATVDTLDSAVNFVTGVSPAVSSDSVVNAVERVYSSAVVGLSKVLGGLFK